MTTITNHTVSCTVFTGTIVAIDLATTLLYDVSRQLALWHLIKMADVTLLFCHGAGFSKETWEPIVRRMRESPMLQSVRCEVVCFDFSFHGENAKEEPKPRVYSIKDGAAKRVDHPGNVWEQWAPEEAHERAAFLLNDRKRPVIGIGHSMGASALWGTEARHPGTFEALILFEPMYFDGNEQRKTIFDMGTDFLVATTLKRQGKWYARARLHCIVLSI